MTIYSLDILLSQFGTSPLFQIANRFLRRQVRWSGIPISLRIFQFTVIHTIKGSGIVNKVEIVNKAEMDIFPSICHEVNGPDAMILVS